MGFACLIINVFFLQESYAPQILVEKASTLRRQTKNWGIHAKQDEIEIDFRELLEKNFSRPLRMLFTERIVLLVSIYMAFIYGLLYLFLTAYPLVFQRVHRMTPGVGGLPYFGMMVGESLACLTVFLRQPGYERKLIANNNVTVPEWRLPEVILGGACFAAGLFWFGWTGYRADIHWIVPTLSGLLLGYGILLIFLPLFNYLIDSYLVVSLHSVLFPTGFPSYSYFFSADMLPSSPPQPSLRIPFSAVSRALRSRSSPAKCSKAWASSGRLPCWGV